MTARDRQAMADSANCPLQTGRSDVALNISKVASISPAAAPVIGQLPTVVTGRYLASVSSISRWRPEKGSHRGDRLVRSFSVTARMAVRLNDSRALRGAVNDRRQ